MAKYVKHPLFLVCCLTLIAHQLIEKVIGLAFPLLDNYLDDVLAMPIILTIVYVEQRYVWKRIHQRLKITEVLLYTLVFAIFFEEILPQFHEGYTRDNWDYLAYLVGSLLFYKFIK